MNNSCLGNVMDFQAPDRRIATEYPEADFAAIGRAMGCEGVKIKRAKQLKPALKAALESDRPTVIDILTSQEAHFRLMV